MQQARPQRKRNLGILYILIGILVIFLIYNAVNNSGGPERIDYTRFVTMIGMKTDADGNRTFENNQIFAIVQQGNSFYIRMNTNINNDSLSQFQGNPSRHARFVMFYQNTFEITEIIRQQIDQADTTGERIHFQARSIPASFFEMVIPFLYLAGILILAFVILRSFAGRGGISQMGKNRATIVLSSPVRFADVAGIDEEKQEVEEIVQFLRNPRKFLDLGARIPKGFLLIGQPGTGKTLLAKAIAGEAGVPFFSISGSDFSEMLVGVGPSRMRDLFEQAKINAPCIIFIDEIDSIARMRGVGISGASEENEQTLNQLLVQMDGFTKSEGVIVLGATNRPDVLDQALLRPGRFDRQIVVQMPDVAGREKVLQVHSKHKPIAADVDLKRVAQIISGFTPADIENLMNESAIIAAKKDRKKITMVDITEGINKVLLGPQKRSRIITDEDKRITAFHEAGHAVVSRILQPKHTVQEVSIIPRGMAAGYTLTNDKDDVTAHKSKTYLKAQLALLLAGRAAEAVFLDDICTGAQQDLKIATNLAEKMVTSFGMSDKLGPLYYGRHDEAIMRAYSDRSISEGLQTVIDNEIRDLMTEAEKRAHEVLKTNKKQVEAMVEILMQRETIYAEDIDMIMEGKSVKQVVENMEQRLETARKAEERERIEGELAKLERELKRIHSMAQGFIQNKLLDEERMARLMVNFDLARRVVATGGILEYLPTLDNIDTYDKLVKVEEPQAEPAKPAAKTPKPKTEKETDEGTQNDPS